MISAAGYDGFGFKTSSVQNQNASGTTGVNNVTTTYAYDAFGNLAQTDADTGSGNLDARTTSSYDFAGDAVVSTTYPGTAGTGTARTTTSHFASYHVPAHTPSGAFDGQYLTQPKAGGLQLPVAPSGSPAPACPDGSGYCNSLTVYDMNGQMTAAIDANGRRQVAYSDVAGRNVASIANFSDGVYNPSSPDVDNVTLTQYGINGKVAAAFDTLANGSTPGNSTQSTYDALARATKVTTYDNSSPAAVALTMTRTVYTAAGRIDRTSLPADPTASDASLTWSKNVYDSAGNQTKTLSDYDITGSAGTMAEGFERGSVPTAWSLSSNWFVNPGSTLSLGHNDTAQGALSGRDRLQVGTSSSSANSGVFWDLHAQSFDPASATYATFKAAHTYRLQADVLGPSGSTLNGFLGYYPSGADYVEDTNADTSGTQSLSLNGTWQTVSLAWTPTADRTTSVGFALRKDAVGQINFYVDNVRIWDTADPSVNIPAETVYDATGQAVESIAPSASLQTKDPVVSAIAFDPNGRSVSSVVNASNSYSSAIIAEPSVTNYYPLDEISGPTLNDYVGSQNLTISGGVALGQAGAVDEARTSATFDGNVGQAAGSDSINGTAYSIEAWVRADATGETSRGLAGRWDATSGGALLELDGSGYYTLAHSATSANFLHSNVAPRVGKWDHVVATWDGSTERLYVNGSLVASQAVSSAPGTSTSSFTIGRNGSATGFLGGIDEVALYSAALSATAVSTHFAAARPTATDVRLTTSTRYDVLGRAVDAWNDAGTRTHYAYDRLGNLTDATENYIDGTASGATATDDLHSTYGYDVLGEMTSYCPADAVYSSSCATGGSWVWTWDQMGRRASETPPTNTGTGTTARDATTWTFNVDGTLASVSSCPTSICSSVDRHTNYAYDGVGRQTAGTVYAGAGTGSPAVKNATMYRGDGLPVELDEYLNGSGTAADSITETYTPAKEVDQVKRGSTVLTDYNYNPDGTLSSRIDGDAGAIGTTTYSQYDWAHRVTQVTLPSTWTSNQLTYAYNPDGTLAKTTEPNGEQITFAYDNAKRATGETMSSGSSLGRTFDRLGNVTSDTRSFSGVSGDPGTNTDTYTFDALDRLTSESGLTTTGASKTYTYDLDSNRTQMVAGAMTFTYAYDQNDQLVYDVKTGGTTQYFSYDKYGNMTGDAESAVNVTTLAYDLADRLTSETPAGGSATTFTYDALARPSTRAVPGAGTDTYSYVGTSSNVDRINNSVSGITDSILDANGARIGTKVSSAVGWYLDDLLGNIVGAEGGATTTTTDAVRYDGFGQTVATSPSGGSSVSRNWKFQGRLDISPNGAPLYEAGARLYSPGIAAFTSVDSVIGKSQNPITMNRYLYAGGNAVTNVDPSGNNYYDPGCDCVRASPIAPDKTSVATAPSGGTAQGGSGDSSSTLSQPDSSTSSENHHGAEGWATATADQGSVDASPALHTDLSPRMGGGCLSASLTIPVLFGGQLCLVGTAQDWLSGKVIFEASDEVGGSTGLSANLTVGGTATNARSASDLNGWAVDTGVSGGLLAGGGADLTVGKARDGYGVWQFTAGGGSSTDIMAPGLPIVFHGGATYTDASRVDLAQIPSIPFFFNPWVIQRLFYNPDPGGF